MAADRDGEKSPFRWLAAAARFAVASVVTVFILVVFVKTIEVLLSPDSMSISVVRGCIFARRNQSRPTIDFDFSLLLRNPISRDRVYLVDIRAYLFDKDTSAYLSVLKKHYFMRFQIDDTESALQEQEILQADVAVTGEREKMRKPFFDVLYNSKRATLNDVTMRLDASIITQVTSGSNESTRPTTYYCWPLVVGVDRVQFNDYTVCLNDVFCREEERRHLI